MPAVILNDELRMSNDESYKAVILSGAKGRSKDPEAEASSSATGSLNFARDDMGCAGAANRLFIRASPFLTC